MYAKKYYFILLIILTTISTYSQNLGIGNSNPAYKLDVLGSVRLRSVNPFWTAGVWFHGNAGTNRSFIGTHNDNHFGIYGVGSDWNFMLNNTNGNLGISTTLPQYRLDVNGRMRIQHDGSSTAGIWFDGISLPTRSFIGTNDDNYIGIWGSGGIGWNFMLNVNNGYIGIGTTSPTKDIDLNGTLRIRSNTPVKGSVLTAKDNLGNAEWANPIAFKSEGTLNNQSFSCTYNTWTKVMFNQSLAYNTGNGYDANASEFLVPTNGVYEFNSSLDVHTQLAQSIRLRLNRGGTISTIAELYNKSVKTQNDNPCHFKENLKISAEANLLVGDKVWVEVYGKPYSGGNFIVGNEYYLTWFSGSLIYRN